MKFLLDFRLCLSFLSRFKTGPHVLDPDFSRTLAWFVPCGLILGLCLSLPLWILKDGPPPAALAWIVVLGEVYLTRGLHWDGWADFWDAVGSNARGERFWEILKDSRIGVFGALGIALGISGEIVLLSAAEAAWTAVVWAMVLGRLAPVLQARMGQGLERPGLGQMFIQKADRKTVLGSCAGTAIIGALLIGPWGVFVSGAVLTPALCGLQATARRQGGLNGDFLGAGIISGQLAGYLGAALI
ncbi:MAG: adenosylcobinamide-GDP ribazoletransferase [Desulfonatronovibrionaceae bacterium]